MLALLVIIIPVHSPVCWTWAYSTSFFVSLTAVFVFCITCSERSNLYWVEDRLVARFQDLGGQNTFYGGKIFAFIIWLKQIFLGTKKFKGGTAPDFPPWLRAWSKIRLYELLKSFASFTWCSFPWVDNSNYVREQ